MAADVNLQLIKMFAKASWHGTLARQLAANLSTFHRVVCGFTCRFAPLSFLRPECERSCGVLALSGGPTTTSCELPSHTEVH